MKIYKIYQDINNKYDTYDSFIVCAEDEEDAKVIITLDKEDDLYGSWVKDVKDIQVEYLGEAKEGLERGELLASFNAG